MLKEVSQTGYMHSQSWNNHLYVNKRNATEGSIYVAFMLWEQSSLVISNPIIGCNLSGTYFFCSL